jgi:hypothetical protein
VTPHQIVVVALRLFAVWLGLQALWTVPAFFNASAALRSPASVYMTFMLTLSAVVILVLWFFPRTIAGKALPVHDTQSQPSATSDTWLAVGCALIGVWTLTNAIPQLAYDSFVLISMSGHDERSQLPQWGYHLVQLAIALWLVLGGKGVGKIFRWAQDVGTKKDL